MAEARVCQIGLDETIERLHTYVQRMERRYECTSELALSSVAQGHMKETAEVSKWLTSYRSLLQLREAAGLAPGTTTATTR